MMKFNRKTVYVVFGAYALYRYVSLQSEAEDGTASMVDDIMSTLQTGVALVSTSSADVNNYFSCRDPQTGIDWTSTIMSGARSKGVPPLLIASQLHQESGFRASIVNSIGARGIAQFMPNTYPDYGLTAADCLDPAKAIPAQCEYMRRLYKQFGTWKLALAAYNWGPGNLRKYGLGEAPPETIDYIAKIYTPYAALIGT